MFGGRIAYRLVAGEPGGSDGAQVDRRGRIAGWVAAVVAGVGVLLIAGDSHVILSGQSDPMIVALCLGAIDMQLSRRYRWALAFWLLASLGRPEAWPFLGLYVIWAWRAVPSMRRLLIGAVVLLLVLWFGIPAITSRSPFVAGTNAFGSGRAPHGNKATATISRFAHLQPVALSVLALVVGGVGGVATRAGGAADGGRDRAVGRRRDRVRPARMAGGAAVHVRGRRSARGDRRDRRRVADPRARAMVGRGGMGRRGAGVSSPACVLVPTAVSRARAEHKDLGGQRARTVQINALRPALSAAGGAALVRACGEPLTRLEYQSIVAFTLGVNVAHVGWKYAPAIHSSRPIVLITPGHGRWKIQALHQRSSACRRLPT